MQTSDSSAASATHPHRAFVFHETGGKPSEVWLHSSHAEQDRRLKEIIRPQNGHLDCVTLVLSSNDSGHTYVMAHCADDAILTGQPPNASLPRRPNGSSLHGTVVLTKHYDNFATDESTTLSASQADVDVFIKFLETGRRPC